MTPRNSTPPVSVLDVAAHILDKLGRMSTWKLQKLVYYSQVWSLVWDENPLFTEEIQAWTNGPVCPALYEKHKGDFYISGMPDGDSDAMNEVQKETVDEVLRFYGPQPLYWLNNLRHMEDPWKNARKGLSLEERGESTISLEAMAEYYESLTEEDKFSNEDLPVPVFQDGKEAA